ncbi:MAG TPA: hypothetical protein VGQ53_01325 [Chitinophagaceae bacterium]|nr:hypothetical protein [Chitinophagaceae bacterium]
MRRELDENAASLKVLRISFSKDFMVKRFHVAGKRVRQEETT